MPKRPWNTLQSRDHRMCAVMARQYSRWLEYARTQQWGDCIRMAKLCAADLSRFTDARMRERAAALGWACDVEMNRLWDAERAARPERFKTVPALPKAPKPSALMRDLVTPKLIRVTPA